MEYRNFIDPEIIHNNIAYCFAHGGPKDCLGKLHRTTYKLYDENGNELTDENRYVAKIYFKCKCDKCGYETFLTYDPAEPCILY